MTRTPVPLKQHPFRLHLLGAFRLESVPASARAAGTAQPIALLTRKLESLLAYLALHPEAHAREKLAALVWGESTDAQARNSLRNALSVLRKQVDADCLIVDRETVQVTPGFPLWVDAVEFKEQVERYLGTKGGERERVDLGLYRGELLADFYDEWVLRERESYRTLYYRIKPLPLAVSRVKRFYRGE